MNVGQELKSYDGRRVWTIMELTLYFDGSCEAGYPGGPRNPGGVATCGWLLKEGDQIIASKGHFLRRGPGATNNVAEYSGLGFALRCILDNNLKPEKLIIYGDSKLVIEQLSGHWKCNADHLRRLLVRCHELLGQINCPWTATWIPREQNAEADALTQQAYVTATGRPYPVSKPR